jgi:hypothetical protein
MNVHPFHLFLGYVPSTTADITSRHDEFFIHLLSPHSDGGLIELVQHVWMLLNLCEFVAMLLIDYGSIIAFVGCADLVV